MWLDYLQIIKKWGGVENKRDSKDSNISQDSTLDSKDSKLKSKSPRDSRISADSPNSYNSIDSTDSQNPQDSYIVFLDSDDYLETYALEYIAQILSQNKVEIIAFSKYYSDIDGIKHINPAIKSPQKYKQQHYKTLALLRDSHLDISNAIWNYIYNADFLLNHNIKFIPKIYHEDVLFSKYAFVVSSDIFIANRIIYNYRIRSGSITTTIVNELSIPHMKHSLNSYYLIINSLISLANTMENQLKKEFLLDSGKSFIPLLLNYLPFVGYAKDLDFNKSDLKKLLPHIKFSHRFCVYCPRIAILDAYPILKSHLKWKLKQFSPRIYAILKQIKTQFKKLIKN
ncbi:hypothetical protein CCY99_04740 [Helicobacter sp. 16-1353]|uniref:hypothetical protein n=1 Tax=Helicobacter sp. 16-1353 TaxID=2004996 RepID=UPI000DCC9E3F|nr:hypothetical protein [Helicobacter sp. 16-1353]RAX53993.1 hypothetical protein CCY99_04740 [Helicobacter sp. 16-1353]